MSHLLEDSSGDPTYVEDFLLTHRIFIESPLIVCNQLLEWYTYIIYTICVAVTLIRSKVSVTTPFCLQVLMWGSFS